MIQNYADKATCCSLSSFDPKMENACLNGVDSAAPCWVPGSWFPERSCTEITSGEECIEKWYQSYDSEESCCNEYFSQFSLSCSVMSSDGSGDGSNSSSG